MSGLLDATFGRSFAGVDVIETVDAIERVEDWSKCRSPSRARRRLNRGFPQRLEIHWKPTSYIAGRQMFIHPVLAERLRQRLKEQVDRSLYETVGGRTG